MDNDSLLASWQLSLHAKSPGTVALYLDVAQRFAGSLDDGDLLTATPADAQRWFTDMRARGLAQATLRSRWIALRNLYGWLHAEQEIVDNPLARVKVPKANDPAPDVLTDDEVRKLLKACEGTGFLERRDMALIRFLLATGVRITECCSLKVADVELRDRIALIRQGKGDRQRLVRFDTATAAALDRYLRVRGRHAKAKLPGLWISHMGQLTRKGAPTILDRRARQAGIGHVHPHQFRHSWADRWLRAGGNEGDLQRLGGWESPEIMRRYGEARAVDRALAAYDSVDPMRDV